VFVLLLPINSVDGVDDMLALEATIATTMPMAAIPAMTRSNLEAKRQDCERLFLVIKLARYRCRILSGVLVKAYSTPRKDESCRLEPTGCRSLNHDE
jgi:hypothetical protein